MEKRKCSDCGDDFMKIIRGMCGSCYQRWRKKNPDKVKKMWKDDPADNFKPFKIDGKID